MQPAWLGRLVVFSACVHGGLMQADHMHALPSPGCGRQPPVDPAVGRGQYLDLEVDGWARGLLLRLPTSYVATTPHPLVLGLHGWTLAGCDAMEEFDIPVEAARVIGVFPQGIEDCAKNSSHCYSSWNGGGCSWQHSPDGSPTCANWTVDPWDGSPGPTSCRAAGRSNRGKATGNGTNCNWCTCVDDVSFLRQVIDMMLLELCVDMSRVYATGESNGGMLLWDLLAQTDRLVAAAPWVSAPARGFLRLPPATASYRPSIMKLFARWDTTIPPDGSTSALGWTFESNDDVMTAWAGHLSCAGEREAYATEADGKEYGEWTSDGRTVGNLSCVRPHGRCQAAAAGHSDQLAPELVNCAYDGTHYSNMMGDAPEVIWEFFLKQRRRGPIAFAHPPLGASPMPRRISLKEVRKFEQGGHQRHRPRHYDRFCYTWPYANSNGIGYDCGSYKECGVENDEPEPEPEPGSTPSPRGSRTAIGNTHHHELLVAGLAIGGVVLLLLGGLGLFLRARCNKKSPLEQSLNAAIQSERH